jgi:mRNA-degrading endonuclease RelE of RelBE toxin-antitoxin system
MSNGIWVCELSEDAEKDLRALPRRIQERVARAIEQFENDPFRGDVQPLRGLAWKSVFRRRLGDYRMLFSAEHGLKKWLCSGYSFARKKHTGFDERPA